MTPFRVRHLFEDAGTGKLSHTRLWSNVGSLILTVAFFRDAWLGGLTDMKMLAYGGIVVSASVASKLISLRYGGGYNGEPRGPIIESVDEPSRKGGP